MNGRSPCSGDWSNAASWYLGVDQDDVRHWLGWELASLSEGYRHQIVDTHVLSDQ